MTTEGPIKIKELNANKIRYILRNSHSVHIQSPQHKTNHTRVPSLTHTRSEFDSEQILVTELKQRIFELEHQLVLREKEIEKLKSVNEFLQTLNKNKESLIFEERKQLKTLKDKIIVQSTTPKSQHRPIIKKDTYVINIRSSNHRQSEMFDGQNFLNQVSNHTQETALRVQSNQIHNLITEQQNKTSYVLDLNADDDELMYTFINNPLNKFVNGLLADEDKFLNLMSQSSVQKMLFIYEQLKRMASEQIQQFQSQLRLKLLIKAANQLSMANNLDEALESIIQQSVKCMNCDRASCFILDEHNQQLWSRVAKGINGVIRIPVKKGICGFVAQTRRLLNIHNAYSDPRFDSAFDKKTNYKTKTILCLPIMKKEQCLGVIQLINKNDGHFTKEDEYFGKILCEFSTVVLSRAISKDETMIAVSKLRQCVKFGIQSKRLGESPLEEKLHLAEKTLKQLMNTELSRVIKYQDEKMYYLEESGEIKDVHSPHSLFGRAIQKKQQFLVSSCSENIDFSPEIDLKTNLPVVTYPVIKDNLIYGAFQVPLLRGIQNLAILISPRIYPIDEEILEAYNLQLLELFE